MYYITVYGAVYVVVYITECCSVFAAQRSVLQSVAV